MVIAIIFVYDFNSKKLFAITLNSLFSSRIEQMAYFWGKYKITFFGQVLENVSSSMASTTMQMHGLDNGYLYMILGQGLIFTLIFLLLSYRTLRKFYNEKKYLYVLTMIIMFMWGMMETTVFRLELNCILLLFSYGLYFKNKGAKV